MGTQHIPSPPSGEDRGPTINRASVALYAVAVLVVGLRFCTRGWVVRKFGVDDYFIATALILGGAQTATIVLQVKYGWGRHVDELTIHQMNMSLLYKWIFLMVYFVSLWAVKMSILALYSRIGSRRTSATGIAYRVTIWGVISFISLYTIAYVFAEIFKCTPVQTTWNIQVLPKGCFYAAAFNTSQAAINVATDIVLLLFPMPLIWQLQISKKQRIALFFVFSIGLIPLSASIKRLAELIHSSAKKGQSWLIADVNWNWAYVPLWSQIEVDVAIIAASLPSLSPLLKKAWIGFSYGSASPYENPTYAKGRQSYGLQAIGSDVSRGESNATYGARCMMGAENTREQRAQNESQERIIGVPEKFNGVVKTVDVKVQYGGGASSQKSDQGD